MYSQNVDLVLSNPIDGAVAADTALSFVLDSELGNGPVRTWIIRPSGLARRTRSANVAARCGESREMNRQVAPISSAACDGTVVEPFRLGGSYTAVSTRLRTKSCGFIIRRGITLPF